MTPQDLGLPFPGWRPGQWDLVQDIAATPDPYQLLIAPTGFGKSLTYTALAQLTGMRTVILTATRSLQDQLMRDFSSPIGLVDVRGQSNYECIAASDPSSGLGAFFRRGRSYTVRDAPCTRGVRCPFKDSGCLYYDRVREASRADIFVTNYDFWMRNQEKIKRVRPVDLLVMDEAHQAPQELADFMSFRISPDQFRGFARSYPKGESVDDWAEWAEWASGILRERVKGQDDPAPKTLDLLRDLERMAEVLGAGEWVIEHMEKGGVNFDCVNPESFGQRCLWGGAGRTLLVSATVNTTTGKALGMPEKEIRVWQGQSNFPKERRPVYVVQGAVRLNFRSTEGEKRMWVALIDRILASRGDRKGIIHTTSFERARYLLQHSAHSRRLLLNDSSSTALTVARFKAAPSSSGLTLVSPSVTTGWDFPGTECEFQIVGKIPFPDLRTKAAKVVNKKNKDWSGYSAAQVIVQASGRGMRSAQDSCETFIVDGNFGWWWDSNRRFLPQWWQESVVWVQLATIPAPLPKL